MSSLARSRNVRAATLAAYGAASSYGVARWCADRTKACPSAENKRCDRRLACRASLARALRDEPGGRRGPRSIGGRDRGRASPVAQWRKRRDVRRQGCRWLGDSPLGLREERADWAVVRIVRGGVPSAAFCAGVVACGAWGGMPLVPLPGAAIGLVVVSVVVGIGRELDVPTCTMGRRRAAGPMVREQVQPVPKERDEAEIGREKRAKQARRYNAHEKNRQDIQPSWKTLAVRPRVNVVERARRVKRHAMVRSSAPRRSCQTVWSNHANVRSSLCVVRVVGDCLGPWFRRTAGFRRESEPG